jgi:(5-formylfuran-3-yl)methyl phosphate transaminase
MTGQATGGTAGRSVAVTPGLDFGAGAEGYLRISYASGLRRIREAMRRLDAFLGERASR